MSWAARLELDYRREGPRTVSHDRHEGPLRVLQRLYPEGPGICHHVLVHPPGGIVGGDTLDVEARLAAGTHAVITTPGATRFYRSDGPQAHQQATLALSGDSRLEWLPLETIAYSGCIAENRLTLTLDPGAEAMGWDVLALGLPAAGAGFDRGSYQQHLELPGVWLERGRLDAADRALMDGPLGLAGRRVLGTLWFAAGSALLPARRAALLEIARETAPKAVAAPAFEEGGAVNARVVAGVTSPHAPVIVMRLLAERVEPAMAVLAAVRAAWRQAAWGLAANPPRIWRN